MPESIFSKMISAVKLRQKGGDLVLIKEALADEPVQTTEIYAHLGRGEFKGKLAGLINQ